MSRKSRKIIMAANIVLIISLIIMVISMIVGEQSISETQIPVFTGLLAVMVANGVVFIKKEDKDDSNKK